MQKPIATWNKLQDCWISSSSKKSRRKRIGRYERLGVFSETLPKSGTMRNGKLYPPQTQELLTSENESSSSPGLLRTPCAAEAEGGMMHPDKAEREKRTLRLSSQIVHMVAPDQLKDDLFPTPAAYDGMKGGPQRPEKRRAGGHQPAVADVVEHLLPTPKAGDADFGLPRTSGRPPERSTHLATRLHFTDFGQYATAIERWESVVGREAPAPTELTPKGKHRLSPRFVEWMMGLPEGRVTDPEIGLTRPKQLRALGNGVVPQQAERAIGRLLKRMPQ